MSRTDDEREDFIEFIEWLNLHDWITGADAKKRQYLVDEFIKDRQVTLACTEEGATATEKNLA